VSTAATLTAGAHRRAAGAAVHVEPGRRRSTVRQPRTVDFHLRNVFTKLGDASRAELIVMDLLE
jgi:hypothetical protein